MKRAWKAWPRLACTSAQQGKRDGKKRRDGRRLRPEEVGDDWLVRHKSRRTIGRGEAGRLGYGAAGSISCRNCLWFGLSLTAALPRHAVQMPPPRWRVHHFFLQW